MLRNKKARAGRPRVVVVCHDVAGQQGVDRAVRELLLRAANQVEFTVVTRTLAPDLRPLVRWVRAPAPGRPYLLKATVFFVVAGLRLLGRRADLVHAHATGALVPTRADLLTVHFFRHVAYRAFGTLVPDRSLAARLSTRFHLAVERWAMRRARALSALSEGSRRELREEFPDARIVVTPNGADLERFRPDPELRSRVRVEEGLGVDEVVAVFVGNAFKNKGLRLTIEGLGVAARRGGGPNKLLVIGRGGAERYRAVAEEHGVGDRVRFLGVRDDVERWLVAADLFVLPSAYENHSLAATEAAASALPLVLTAVSGTDELIGDGEAGIVVERTPESVAAALETLASDRELRRRLGEAARTRALDLSWDDAVESVLTAYDELLHTELTRAKREATPVGR